VRLRDRLAVIAICVGLVACSPAASASPPDSAAPTLSGAPTSASSPTQSAVVSVQPDEIVEVGDRQATVHMPPGAGSAPAPLILLLHGYGSSASEHRSYFGFDREASTKGVVLAYPEGTRDRDGNRFWNATEACCDFHGSDVDDVAYLVELAEEIGKATPIDPKRVYLVGHSNGGFMSYRMACEQAARVAAIVSLAGATYDDEQTCAPSEPVAVLQIHGTGDDTILFLGGTLDIGGTGQPRRYPGAKSTATSWASYDGCASTLVAGNDMLDIDGGIDGENGSRETTVEVSNGCGPGGHVELWTIPGGSHVPNLSASFASAVIDFLLDHPKP
jgi:polyhydroxybutyrate depolymerase